MCNVIFKIDDEYSFLTEDLLKKEYLENKLTDKQIAKKYNVKSKVTIWRRRKFFNIENRFVNKVNKNAVANRKFSISHDDAAKWLTQGLTYVEIAEKIGCGRMVAYRRMKEMGLIDDQKQNIRKLKWHEVLTENQTKFILGCLLGDGNITHRGMFQCSHSHKQLDYIIYKKEIFKNLVPPNFVMKKLSVKNHQNDKIYYSYFLRTMNNENLKKIHDKYYINGNKIFPLPYIEKSIFDAYSLAIWYMDDGSRNYNIPTLWTLGFGYDGNLDILRFFKKKFDLEGCLKYDIRPEKPLDKIHYITFAGTEREKFFTIVSPYILPCFRYKLPEKYRSKIK